jgi:Ankyrin repeats (3 copies)
MSPDPKDNAGYTPLHEACSRGHLEIARILLQYGANHSETALSGIRPLHEAIENGHIEIVRLLISFGADPCLATYSGQLPISMAEDKDMEDFLSEYLIDIDDKKGKIKSWYFEGPFKADGELLKIKIICLSFIEKLFCIDPTEQGYEVFNDVPINRTDLGLSNSSVFSTSLTSLVTATTQMSDTETIATESSTATPLKAPLTPMKAPSQDLIKYKLKMKKCDTNSNNLVISDVNTQDNTKMSLSGKKTKSCSAVSNNIGLGMKKIKKLPAIPKQEQITPPKLSMAIQKLEEIKHKEYYDDMMVDADNLESDSEFFEVEESEAPLPPLYLLKDEGSDKWILLTDLCNLLKVKSKDAVLKQVRGY